MRASAAQLLMLAVILAGCASPTASGGGKAPELRVTRPDVLLEALGDSSSVTATLDGHSTETPALAIESEARYLHEAAVLDSAALARGMVRAAAPGSAVLSVRAFGAAPVRVRVEVRPRRPVVLSAAADGDTLRLRGWRLAGVRDVSVGGAAVRVLVGDSATLRALLPAAPCDARQALHAGGAEVAPGVEVVRRALAVRLAAGEVLPLAGAAHCIRLPTEPDARYALAFLDTRRTTQARDSWEGIAAGPARYTVTVAEAGSPPRAALAATPLHTLAADEGTAATDARLFARTLPWRTGDRFETLDPATGAPMAVRVAAVHGTLVLAVAQGQAAEGGTERWLAQADTALRFLAADGYTSFRAALGTAEPTTSAGQLLVVASRGGGTTLGAADSRTVDGQPRSVLYLNLAHRPAAASSLLRVLAHEVAHAWQARYAADTRPAGAADPATGALWAVEGTAELLAWWTLGRFHGIAPDANWDWRHGMGDPTLVPYALLAAGTRDAFAEGYASAASYALDVAARMVRAGSSWDAALAAVSRGALDGWYGYAPSGARRAGLAARVRPVLGDAWTPEGSLLTWTLTQAVDDVAAAPAFQNLAFLRAHTGPSAVQGWGAPAVLNTGRAATRVHVGAASEVWGNAAAVSPLQGSPSYVLLDDHGAGGTYTLSAVWNGAPLPGVQWALLRYR